MGSPIDPQLHLKLIIRGLQASFFIYQNETIMDHTEEKTLLVELDINYERHVKLKLVLPFYGKVPGRNRWIRITNDIPPQITTISISEDGCETYEWTTIRNADVHKFTLCSLDDWINAKYAAARSILNLKNK